MAEVEKGLLQLFDGAVASICDLIVDLQAAGILQRNVSTSQLSILAKTFCKGTVVLGRGMGKASDGN